MTTITDFLTADDVGAAFRSPQQLIELLDDPVNPTGTLNEDLRDAILARVNGEIAGAISHRYAIPLTVADEDAAGVKATINGHAMTLFRWYAMEDKPRLLESFTGLQTSLKMTKQWLADVRDGVEFIGTSKSVPAAEARVDDFQTGEHKGTFTRDRLKGF